MVSTNLLVAAANARAAEQESAEVVQHALPTGETIEDFEPLTRADLDPKGCLYIEQDGLRSLIECIFGVVKEQNEKCGQFADDIYDVRSNLTAVERQCVHLNVQLKDCMESVQKAMLQMNTMSVTAAGQQNPDPGTQSGILGGQDQALSTSEALEDLTERFDNFERLISAHVESTVINLKQVDEKFALQEHTLEYDVSRRIERNEEAMETIREDIDALRKRAVEESARKADRSDVLKLTEWLMRIEEGQNHVCDDILKAKDDFKHLNAMANEMVDTRHQCQELWRLVREESREVRDWISHGLDDLRREVRSKAVASEVCNRLEEVQKDVTALAGRMQAVAHLKAQLHTKAERNDVRRLQEASDFVTKELVNHGAVQGVLASTTCLACNRPMEKSDRIARGGREDCHAEEHQGRRLIGDVRTALDKGQGDMVEYVAVNVGSPVREKGTDGRLYEGRSPSPGPGTIADGPDNLRLVQVRRPGSAAGSYTSGPSRPPSRCASPNLTAGTKGFPKTKAAPLYLRPAGTNRSKTPDPALTGTPDPSNRAKTPDSTSARAVTPEPISSRLKNLGLAQTLPETLGDVLGKKKSKDGPMTESNSESLTRGQVASPSPTLPPATRDSPESIKILVPSP